MGALDESSKKLKFYHKGYHDRHKGNLCNSNFPLKRNRIL